MTTGFHLIAWALALLGAVAHAGEPVLVTGDQAARLWSPQVRRHVAELVALGPAPQLPAALAAIAEDSTLAPAMRDAALYAYLQTLRQQPAHAQSDAALAWLSGYRAQAEVLHPESASHRIPLFDVAAQARGIANEKQYRLGAEAVATQPPGQVLHGYAEAGEGPYRRGVDAAVRDLPADRRAEWQARVAERSDLDSGTLGLNLALAEGSLVALRERLSGSGPALATILLTQAESVLDPRDWFALCRAAADHADPGIRALAIALGARAAKADASVIPDWRDWLGTALADPEAGPAAALQLARLLDDAELALLKAQTRGDPVLRVRMDLIERLRRSPALLPEESGS